MRGKRAELQPVVLVERITPACAGKTQCFIRNRTFPKDHPRVCGENFPEINSVAIVGGSPPRVRGKLTYLHSVIVDLRITPACAGKTNNIPFLHVACEDHPRVCGENFE